MIKNSDKANGICQGRVILDCFDRNPPQESIQKLVMRGIHFDNVTNLGRKANASEVLGVDWHSIFFLIVSTKLCSIEVVKIEYECII